ncbi:lysophospholipid acyltransferase family protein [Carboxylicivirga sp. N1Y90]|uniref:lysophospholipid acyltransferase family protein n=1 Tax=Carboxylicivirga fragile TaxID=3417571 RepID=UPI003D339EF7|nr:lysophospholipid acyltransferase family protein [Marinilabiliaceae bacterium N1Y90]
MQISDQSLHEIGIPVPSNQLFKRALFSYLRVNKINRILGQITDEYKGISFINNIFDQLNINYNISDYDLKNIPQNGPFIIMSNHPYGFLDGLIMIHLLAQKHPQFKVMANFFLKQFDALNPYFIDLNPFQTKHITNVKGIRTAYQHLQNGMPIGVFPAGEVSTMQKGFKLIVDKEWDSGIIRFIINANVPIIPLYFEGHNSLPFHLLGKIHPYLRTLSIPNEFFKQENKTIKLRVGNPISPSELKDFDNIQRAGRYLRASLFGLGSKVDVNRYFKIPSFNKKTKEAIIPAVPKEEIKLELKKLKESEGVMLQKSHYEVYLACSEEIPQIITELGRLREITFRDVGEGTNRMLDIDEYDLY